jgi:hypothetical protein
MKTKGLNILFAGIFALVFLIGFASAAISVSPNSVNLNQFGDAQTFTISNSGPSVTVSLTSQTITEFGKTVTIKFNQTSVTLPANGSAQLTASVVIPVDANFPLGTFSQNYVLTEVGNTANSATLTLNLVNTASKYKNDGNMDVSIDNIKVENGYGSDNSWYPLDEISAKISVDNNNDNSGDKIRNIVVEWGLYNKHDGKWVIKEKESKFNLNEGDTKRLTINFTLDNPSDFEDNGDYVFYAWATGDNEEFSDNKTSVIASPETIEIVLDDDFVVLNNFQVPETIQCDSEVQVSANVWNIGVNDENGVYVKVYNKELGISENVDIGDINSLDSSDFNFNLQLPENVKEKLYYLTLTVYDDNNDVLVNGNDDKAVFSVPLNVQGSCSLAKASLTAVLESGGEAGKPLVVKATIVNTGNKNSIYSLNAAGYTTWASSASLDKTSVTLNAGESAEVLLTFNVNKEALGTNTFNLEVLSGNELVVSQPVQVEITQNKFSIANLFSGDKKYLWGIGVLNLILIILIIVIAVRISRKK